MIIKKLSQGLKDQDWITVSVELVLVVVGILIALEFDTWNEQRKNRAEEQDYLVRLHTDMAASVALFDANIRANQTNIDRLRAILTAIQTGVPGAMTPMDIKKGVMLAGWNGTGFISSTLEELIATGRIALIEDKALRQAIAQVRFEMGRVDRAVDNLGEALLATFSLRGSYLKSELQGADLITTARFEDMIGDETLISVLSQIIYLKFAMNSYLETGRNEAALMHRLLQEKMPLTPGSG